MRQHSSTASARTERVPLAVDVEIERYGVRVEPDPESGRAGLTRETIWPVRNILERDENFLALVGKRLTGPEAEGNSGPALKRKRLVEDHIDPLDVIRIPDLLENAIRESQAEQVENGGLAKKVVDAMDLPFRHELE